MLQVIEELKRSRSVCASVQCGITTYTLRPYVHNEAHTWVPNRKNSAKSADNYRALCRFIF